MFNTRKRQIETLRGNNAAVQAELLVCQDHLKRAESEIARQDLTIARHEATIREQDQQLASQRRLIKKLKMGLSETKSEKPAPAAKTKDAKTAPVAKIPTKKLKKAKSPEKSAPVAKSPAKKLKKVRSSEKSYTTMDLVELTGVGRRTITQMASSGKLPCTRAQNGRTWVFGPDALKILQEKPHG